jgi:hypothetical protein
MTLQESLMDELDSERARKICSGLILYTLTGGAAFSLEVLVYADRGWTQGPAWWAGTFLGIGFWLIAPYFALSWAILKRENSLRQLILILFFTLGVVFFAMTIFFEAFFVHRDPRSWIVYALVPIYQWIAIGGALGLRHAIGRKS